MMNIEYRKNVWNACMESKWRLNSFGNLVLHHLCCKDKSVAKMFYYSDRFFTMHDRDEKSWNEFYKKNYPADSHLSEIKMKCDLLGIRLKDCEDLVGRYAEFAAKGDQKYFQKLMEFCGGEEIDHDRIIAIQSK